MKTNQTNTLVSAREIIQKHLVNVNSIEKSSIEHYAETGKISGTLLIALEKMLKEYRDSDYKYQELKTKAEKMYQFVKSAYENYDEANFPLAFMAGGLIRDYESLNESK